MEVNGKNVKVLGLIPARGGSKGVPRKNIKLLGGKPLLQYTAEAALGAKMLSRVILSTEDEEIARVGMECGIDMPFMRPIELAKDDTPTLPVVQDVLRKLQAKGEHYDAVCLLQPTNPLRKASDIDACIEMLFNEDLDSVFSVLPVPLEYNPHWVYFAKDDGQLELATGGTDPIPRRQLLPPAFHREGSIYITRTEIVLGENSFYGKRIGGYKMPNPVSINIDTEEDWKHAENYFASIS